MTATGAKQELVAALEAVCASLRSSRSGSAPHWLAFATGPSKPLFHALRVALEADQDLQPLWTSMVRLSPRSARVVGAGDIAGTLVTRLLRGTTPQVAIDDLMQFVCAKQVEGITVQCVHGLEINERVPLANGLALTPPEALPPSRIRESLFQFDHELNEYSDFSDNGRATMAITVDWSQANTFRAAAIDGGEDETPDERNERWRILGEQVARIQKAFTVLVLAGYEVALGVQTDICLHPGAPMEISARSGYEVQDLMIPNWALASPNLRSDFELIDKFHDWPGLWRLVERLSRARLARDPVDAHTDFGVIAESILTHGDSQTTEIGHRLGVRAGWLLGVTPAARREYDRRAKRLYKLRSAAAHKGKLPSNWTSVDRTDADRLCVELLRKTLSNGDFTSDWASVVFGSV